MKVSSSFVERLLPQSPSRMVPIIIGENSISGLLIFKLSVFVAKCNLHRGNQFSKGILNFELGIS